MAERRELFRTLAIIVACYAVLLAGGVRSHWAGGPPYERSSLGLQIAFATVAALVGLASIWSAFAAVHWSTRASGLIATVAAVAGMLTFFFVWSDFLVWQLVAIVYAQLACLILVLAGIRACGYTLQRESPLPMSADDAGFVRATQFSVRNLLMLTTSLALLFCVLHYGRPVELSAMMYAVVLFGGWCAAVVALVALWACFSATPIAIRMVVAVAVAPAGGILYRVLEQYEALLMSAPWYAGVTTLQLVLMMLPLTLVRLHGYRFTSTSKTQFSRSLGSSTG
jgi:hypothetical protein